VVVVGVFCGGFGRFWWWFFGFGGCGWRIVLCGFIWLVMACIFYLFFLLVLQGKTIFLPLFFSLQLYCNGLLSWLSATQFFCPFFLFLFLPLFFSACGSRFFLFVATYKPIFTSITDILFYSKAVNFLPLFSSQLRCVIFLLRLVAIFFLPLFFFVVPVALQFLPLFFFFFLPLFLITAKL
jgi:hypothetical protein